MLNPFLQLSHVRKSRTKTVPRPGLLGCLNGRWTDKPPASITPSDSSSLPCLVLVFSEGQEGNLFLGALWSSLEGSRLDAENVNIQKFKMNACFVFTARARAKISEMNAIHLFLIINMLC